MFVQIITGHNLKPFYVTVSLSSWHRTALYLNYLKIRWVKMASIFSVTATQSWCLVARWTTTFKCLCWALGQLCVVCKLTDGIAAQISILEFTLLRWGAIKGHTGNEWSITSTLQRTVLHVKLVSRLTHIHTTVLARGRLNQRSQYPHSAEMS